MADRFQAPKGTFDVLPPGAAARERIERTARQLFEHAGYFRIETPAFEDTELFARGVGESTDIVQKEMFTFEDMGGRSLTLRPEGTAPICRGYVEHGMHKRSQPVKLWYWGPFFRHEAPQAGRYRQFTQVGAEVLGTDEPSADAELIVLLSQLLEGCREVSVRISSLGNPRTRSAYRDELRDWLGAREGELSEPVRARLDLNPLRAFDSDDPGTQAVMAEAPKLIDRLDDEDAEHFAAVRSLLDDAGLAYEVDPGLVRGLDYYTRTVFEFESGVLGAQAALGGGGRYDGLVELLGGSPTPGVGWAAGIERILLAQPEPVEGPPRGVFVAVAKPERREEAFGVANDLRAAGVAAELEHTTRSLKGQLKQADRLGVRHTVILGEAFELKDMETG